MYNRGTADKKLIKKMNTIAILDVIRKEGPISRANIAKKLKLNPATISSNVNDLIQKGLVTEKGVGFSNGGRKPILIEVNKESRYIIGVYTELTCVNIGLVNLAGEVIYKQKYVFKVHNDALDNNTVLNTMLEGIDDCLGKTKVQLADVLGIGIGLHGLVNPLEGKSIFAPGYDWHNFDIARELSRYFDVDTVVDNDVRAMALGEKFYGKGEGSDNFMLIHVGEGIGGAFVTNGALHFGASYGAGEIGHIKVTEKAVKCQCGNYGCLTTVASEEGIVNRMKELLISKENSLENMEIINDLSVDDVIRMANEGDKSAQYILNKTCDYIGRAAGVVINILNPEKVLITGHILDYDNGFIELIRDSAKTGAIQDNYKNTIIEKVSIEEDLGVIGAATLVVAKLFSIDT